MGDVVLNIKNAMKALSAEKYKILVDLIFEVQDFEDEMYEEKRDEQYNSFFE